MLSKQLSKKIISNLYFEIPEFKRYVDQCIDKAFHYDSYLIFGPFGGELRDWIAKDASSKLVERGFNFINNLCKENNNDIEQILKVTAFEPLMDYKKSIEISKLKLKDKALTLFEEVLKGVNFDNGKYAK